MTYLGQDLIVLGECSGFFEIVRVSTLEIVFTCQLSHKADIYDIKPTGRRHEYVFATMSGLLFGMFDQKNLLIVENRNERYMKGKFLSSIEEFEEDKFIVAIWKKEEEYLMVFDRKLRMVTQKIRHPTGEAVQTW